jgi:hypothetical protein
MRKPMPTPDFSQARWYKSSRTNGGGGACVTVAHVPDYTGVRDSKLGEASPILPFRNDAWYAFVRDVKDGTYDWPS